MADRGGGERCADLAAPDAAPASGGTPILANTLRAVTGLGRDRRVLRRDDHPHVDRARGGGAGALAGAGLRWGDGRAGGPARRGHERGAFTAADTAQTGTLLRGYALAVIPATVLLLLTRAFHARRDMVTPLWLGGINTALYVAAALLFSGARGLEGLPLAFALSQLTGSILYAWILARALGVRRRALFGRGLIAELGGIVAAGLVLLLVLAAGARVLGPWLTAAPAATVALALGASLAGGAAVYLATARGLGLPEARSYLGKLALRPARSTRRMQGERR